MLKTKITSQIKSLGYFKVTSDNLVDDYYKVVLQVTDMQDNIELSNEKWKLCVLDKEGCVVQKSPEKYPALGASFHFSSRKPNFKLVVLSVETLESAIKTVDYIKTFWKKETYELVDKEMARPLFTSYNEIKGEVKHKTAPLQRAAQRESTKNAKLIASLEKQLKEARELQKILKQAR